jgi:putative membrane protein
MKTSRKSSSLPWAGLTAGLLALGLGSAAAFAQSTPGQYAPGETRPRGQGVNVDQNRDGTSRLDGSAQRDLPRGDRRFFAKAASLGEKEVALSRIAESRAIDPRVREFAGRMVREHTAANARLAELAARKGVTVERRDANDARREEAKWNEKSGDAFDKDYLEAMIDCHEDTVDVLENAADSDDADLAAYARQMLPVVQGHLREAEALEDTLR